MAASQSAQTQVSPMPQNSDPITYLPLPDSLHAAVEEAISETFNIVESHSEPFASNFSLPDNERVTLVVKKAVEAYEKEKKLSQVSVLSSQGAVFKGTWKSGEKNDTLIVPLTVGHIKVTARDADGKETKLDWHWKNAVFVPRHTLFTIEGGHKIGAVIIQFKR
ncbi:hypothetical protein AJ79_10290 [Helicocarpus griseus UAMH5409]|uniref:Uncharacterized protein n=1 Tax=Helicocarpus griseus UAMH5409 TaxID=1447875 RepID=A0A2B7WEI0_9EURO|nr:hypothetical protein AJ79_10290 [Helicocarpus griseus UAMH5409]